MNGGFGINIVHVREIFTSILEMEVKEIKPIIGKGAVNEVFLVKTENSPYIVRMNDAKRAYSIFEKECWCMEQAGLLGIPGPEVISIGTYREVAYMVLTFVEGTHGEDTDFEKGEVWRKLGEYARIFHSIKVAGFGEHIVDLEKGIFAERKHDNFDGTWSGFIKYNVDSLTEDDELVKQNILTKKQSMAIKERFECLYGKSFQFGLIHGDLSLKNTIVNDGGNVTLLDWGSAQVTIVPHYEIIELIRSQIDQGYPSDLELEEFLKGYGFSKSDYFGIKEDMNTLLLLRSIDKLRWALECSPNDISNFISHVKKVLKRVNYHL